MTSLAGAAKRHYETMMTYPRKTLEYFAIHYTNKTYPEAQAIEHEELTRLIASSSKASLVQQIYEEADMQIREKHSQYQFFRQSPHGGRQSICHTEALKAMDEAHLFGKSVFVLFMESGNMDANGVEYYAERCA